MAGESPGKVERRESSGETTDDGGAVASTGVPDGVQEDATESGPEQERKSADGAEKPSKDADGDSGETEAEPGHSADDAAPDEGGGRGDARLKAAVAAWVGREDDETDGDDPEGASAPEGAGTAGSDAAESDDGEGRAEDADAGDVKPGRADSASGETNSSQSPATDLPVRPKAAEGDAGAAAPPAEATAMFRTVRRDQDEYDAEKDSEEAAKRAEQMTSAFFGSAKSSVEEDSAGGEKSAKEDSEKDSGEDPGKGAKKDSGKDSQKDSGKDSEKSSKKDSGAEKPGGRGVDQETTALVVGKQADRRSVDQETTALVIGKQGGAKDDGPKKDGPKKAPSGGVDQATTAFRTVEPVERDKGDKGAKDDAKDTAGAESDAKSGDVGKSQAPSKPRDPRLPAAGKTVPAPAEPESEKGRTGEKKGESPDKKSADKKPGDEKSDSKPADKKPADEKTSGEKSDSKTGHKAGSKPGSKPESDSERTSQFVALRDADAPPRPKRAPSVPAAPPKPIGKPTVGTELPPEAEVTGALPQLSEAERTRQEPRPDQAPLDLLAQLTNTPPPPETPFRNAVRRVKIYTPLAVVLLILFVIAQALRPLPEPRLTLSAAPTHTFQGAKPSVPWPSEGQAALEVQGLGSFGTYGKQKPVPIASVAKVMTAYVILRDHPVKKGSDGPKIPVDKKAQKEAGLSSQNESTVKVKAGDTLTEREAVQAVMIASANNVARLLARWDAGSEEKFVKKMNDAAADLGMKNTKYTDPSGLTASTVSTAADQVKLAKKAMDIDLFRETVRLPGYKDSKGEHHGNWNKLVPLDGVVGIKTGTTTKAGGNLVFAAEQQVGDTTQLIVGAVLGQYRPSILDTVLGESKKLIDAAQDELTTERIVRKGEVVGYVDDQMGGRTPVVASRNVSAVGWSGLKVKLALTNGGRLLPHEGEKGERAGTLTVGDGPGQVRVPLLLNADKTEPGFGAKLTRIL